jgi:hypothetical protein
MSDNEMQALLEIRKAKETASRLANGEYPEDADHVRVLAGMIQHLAEQVERLAGIGRLAYSPNATGAQVRSKEAEAAAEEDQSPGKAPAEPINERT